MATEKIVTSVEDIKEYLKESGVSEKRLERMQRVSTTIPTNGYFVALSTDTFVNEDKESIVYPVLIVHDKLVGGKKIGQISLAQIIQSIASGKARQIKNSPVQSRIGKFFHAGKRLSELQGESEADIILKLMGKKFTATEMPNLDVPKFERSADGEVKFYDTAEEAIQAIEHKDCLKFKISY